MVAVAEAAEPWDLVATIALLIAIIYSMRLYRTFKGGKLARAHLLALASTTALFLTFLVSFILDFVDVVPVTEYGLSIKNIGVLVAVILIVAAGRDYDRFWSVQNTMNR